MRTQDGNSVNIVSLNFAMFAVLLGMISVYFVYFVHQKSEIESDIAAKIVQINAIHTPTPLRFLSISGHKEYFYLQRKGILRKEFNNVNRKIQENLSLTDQELAILGERIQLLITQIAYSFPYKNMIEFKKNGSALFPVSLNSIDTSGVVSPGFLNVQIDEIYHWNYAFTLALQVGKDRIAEAMMLAGGPRDEDRKSMVMKYLDSLTEDYLEPHFSLAMSLGFTIKRLEHLLSKLSKWKVLSLAGILLINFALGVISPLFIKAMQGTFAIICTALTFFVGIALLVMYML